MITNVPNVPRDVRDIKVYRDVKDVNVLKKTKDLMLITYLNPTYLWCFSPDPVKMVKQMFSKMGIIASLFCSLENGCPWCKMC